MLLQLLYYPLELLSLYMDRKLQQEEMFRLLLLSIITTIIKEVRFLKELSILLTLGLDNNKVDNLNLGSLAQLNRQQDNHQVNHMSPTNPNLSNLNNQANPTSQPLNPPLPPQALQANPTSLQPPSPPPQIPRANPTSPPPPHPPPLPPPLPPPRPNVPPTPTSMVTNVHVR